jgi:hypothetical protein
MARLEATGYATGLLLCEYALRRARIPSRRNSVARSAFHNRKCLATVHWFFNAVTANIKADLENP